MLNKIYLLVVMTTGIASAQNNEYKNLVFEGAGIRGIAYVGVLDELERNGTLKSVENVGGTSAGAITALMVSLGYSAEEIKEIIYDTDFRKFNDGRYIFIGGIYRTTKKFGWYRTNKFEPWLGQIIENKTGNPDITFRTLKEQQFKNLYTTGTNLSKQQMEVFSFESYPEMKVKDAVRISMSIPLYFEAVFLDSNGNVYDKKERGVDLDVVVDGGIIGNFPINLFDKDTMIDGKPTKILNPGTLGIKIDSEEQIAQDKKDPKLVSASIKNVHEFVEAFYVFTLESLNRVNLTEEDWTRTIAISDANIGPRVKRLTEAQKDQLIKGGGEGTKEFFKSTKKKQLEKRD